jgi:hypothetical protein
MWLAFTDPEKMARAVPGLIVDAVHAVPPADGPEGVAGDVVDGRLKLRIGTGAGAAITYRGTACIAGAEAHKGTLDIAVDAAQARGNGALAGYLRVTLVQAGDDGERTLISVVPELELSGRALEFARESWHEAVETLGAAWLEVLAAEFLDADEGDEGSVTEAAGAAESAGEPESEATEPTGPEPLNKAEESESEEIADPPAAAIPANSANSANSANTANTAISVNSAISPPSGESLSEDPLAAVWSGRYEKNRWLPVITALTLFLLIKRRRRHRADNSGADSSFRME